MIELKMLLIKLGIKLYYTDTDSIFVDKELPDYKLNLVGKELGQLKDELSGGVIKKAYFLGIKKYGYLDDNNNTHSVFSGVERNSLSWLEIEQIANGFTITKTTKPKFFKNLSNLNIQIKYNPVISILHQTRKQISGNRYIPIKINFKLLVTLDYFLRILKNKIINFLNKYKIGKLK